MYIWTLLHQIIYSLKTHKLRTFLAIFGIMWGTIAVVLLLALGNGFSSANQKNLAAISSGLISVYPGSTSIPYKGNPSGRLIHLRLTDMKALDNSVKDIKWMSPEYGDFLNQKQIRFHTKVATEQVFGVSPQYLKIQQLKMESGSRFFNSIDIRQHARVVFIGNKLSTILFPHTEATGKTVTIQGIPFNVIGVLSHKTSTGVTSFWAKVSAYIPYTTYLDIYGNQDITTLQITPRHPNQSAHLATTIKYFLANHFSFSPKDSTALMIPQYTKVTAFMDWFFFSIRAFLAFAGFMTLGVGGVGVANIMYLIVNERTPEIGLRMALGARDKHVLSQILIEAFLIIFVGGLMGFLICLFVVGVLDVAHLPSWLGKPSISTSSVAITFSILTLTALLSGWFPARAAALMPPAVALK